MATARKSHDKSHAHRRVEIIHLSSEISERDKLILDMLIRNAKTTTTDIAGVLKISDVATRRRIKRLEEEGVILFYTTIVNPKKLGFNVVARLLIETEPSKVQEVASKISEKPYVVELGTLLGEVNLYAVVWAKDLEDLERIVEEIGNIDHVKKIHTMLQSKVLKVNGVTLQEDSYVPFDG